MKCCEERRVGKSSSLATALFEMNEESKVQDCRRHRVIFWFKHSSLAKDRQQHINNNLITSKNVERIPDVYDSERAGKPTAWSGLP